MAKLDPEARISQLEQKLKEKDAYIAHLEKLSEAYNNLSLLFNQELRDADRTLRAQEIIQNMMAEERKNADMTIEAHERLEELRRQEKILAARTIEAHENLETLHRKEKIEADALIKAHELLEEFSDQEKREAESIIEAHEKIAELSREEKITAEEIIRAQAEVSNLSIRELMQKDMALEKILRVNKDISSLLDEELLLDRILKSLLSSVGAQRGALFLNNSGTPELRLSQKLDTREIQKPYFKASLDAIHDCFGKRKSHLVLKKPTGLKGPRRFLSFMAIPLMHQEHTLGVLYADLLSSSRNFKESDLYVAEIFSLQASISINNSRLYEKIKKQNSELLRLMNLKSQLISHLSTDLRVPTGKILNAALGLLNGPDILPGPAERQLEYIQGEAARIENLSEKMITISSLEKEVEELFKDRVDIPALIENILGRHKSVELLKKLDIRTHIIPAVSHYQSNRLMLHIIFDELLSNAIHYNRDNGSVSIRGFIEGEFMVFEIEDTGHGIRKEDLDRVFQQFYRAEGAEELNQSGAGLGLYMVRECAAHYGGSVTVKSRFGKGSNFRVSFLLHES